MENISIHHFFLYLPCTFPQKAQGWARICALYMEKTFTSVWLSGFRTSHLLTCRKNRWQPVTSSWYVYLRTVPSFRGKDMPYTYRRGLSALLVLDRWACEGRAKVRFLRLFYIQAVLMLDLTCPLGVRMNKEGYAAYRTAYSLHASRARTYGDMVCKTVVLHTA